MTEIEAKGIFERNNALRKGHYVLLGKDHSEYYVDKNAVLCNPQEASYLYIALAAKLAEARLDPEIIIGPQMSGALMAPWVAYYLSQTLRHKILSLYAEKYCNDFKLRPQAIQVMNGKKVVLMDDIFQRGTSFSGMAKTVNNAKGIIIGAGVLWRRGQYDLTNFFNCRGNIINLISLINTKLPSWPNEKLCPLCFAGIPINTDLGHGKEFLKKSRDKLFVCPNCGGIADWIDKPAGIFCCRKCHAVPAGLEFD
ncbi:MAG: hypothetical protein COU83_02385 [Candidatus Portnoybacteria bacterium CG10_big_fil_rev_8_21_14_0_10_40_22]|uniref:Uncharacterized protein n=1 Tax=Candidatus Portnoybacteria bacterium CG10_big_fil_rev_8_21_14_0_10_40_22 TaxID=1974814 RepID=A0A2M8KFL9_9BACT|nr:MAG: hypothetical protein COU83_02385 [Candidatus Portnoybacteria bacterium CG10_big_fil_rev_8_21_14_0_10_40_22]